MNIPLLRRIQRQIDKAPDFFIMEATAQKSACGTAYCIAGWACALNGVPLSFAEDVEGRVSWDGMGKAEELLGLSSGQGDKLFLKQCWPAEFRQNGSAEELPALAIKRINHFIATEGME